MIEAKDSFWGKAFWKRYIPFMIRRDFSSFQMLGEVTPAPEKSILMIANHVSWWDGFWAYFANERLWKKQFYAMMLEEQLHQHPILRWAGGFSINPKSPTSIRESMRYTKDLLQEPGSLVLLFPQGKIHSLYQKEILFARGAESLLVQQPHTIQVIFAAAFVDYLQHRKPSVFYYMEEWKGGIPTELGKDYQSFFLQCLERQKTLEA
ncbi:MAG: lysophospholipid acyltransferase family protein [Bacteroidota bacterium]